MTIIIKDKKCCMVGERYPARKDEVNNMSNMKKETDAAVLEKLHKSSEMYEQLSKEEQSGGTPSANEKKEQHKEYEKYVKEVTPTHNLWLQMLKAFITGGIICTIGQFILNYATDMGLDKQTAGSWCSLILVLISVLLTGFNIYPKIVKWGGAGALVPITGFANSVASPAIEYKTEGQVFGIGCKIFTIAGPVILYGIFTSAVLGLVYWIGKMLGWM